MDMYLCIQICSFGYKLVQNAGISFHSILESLFCGSNTMYLPKQKMTYKLKRTSNILLYMSLIPVSCYK